MLKRRFITGIVVVTIALLTGRVMATGGAEDVYPSHMMGGMGDEMMGDEGDKMMEPCMKDPGMKGHMMGKHMAERNMPKMHMWGYLRERLDLTEEQTGQFKKNYK